MAESTMISIIIPAYNAAGTLKEQLEALSAQEWEGHWEVIVADNGSQDGTAEVVRSFGDRLPSLRVIEASERRGAAYARNQGAHTAHGDTLIFVDADDIVQPGWLAAMSRAAAEASIFVGTKISILDTGAASTAGLPRSGRFSRLLPSRGFLDAATTANLGVSRSLWEEVGGFREEYVACEDTAFCWDAQLIAGATIKRVPNARFSYRQRSGLVALWKQQYRWGVGSVQLYRTFKAAGAPNSSTLGALVRWGALAASAPFVVLSPPRRRDWVGRVARRAGRLSASIRFRVVHL